MFFWNSLAFSMIQQVAHFLFIPLTYWGQMTFSPSHQGTRLSQSDTFLNVSGINIKNLYWGSLVQGTKLIPQVLEVSFLPPGHCLSACPGALSTPNMVWESMLWRTLSFMESNSLCFAFKIHSVLECPVWGPPPLRMTWGYPPLSAETLSIHEEMTLETPAG